MQFERIRAIIETVMHSIAVNELGKSSMLRSGYCPVLNTSSLLRRFPTKFVKKSKTCTPLCHHSISVSFHTWK